MFRGSDGAPNLLSVRVKIKKKYSIKKKRKDIYGWCDCDSFLGKFKGRKYIKELFEKQKSGKLTSLSLRCFDTITSVVYIGSN